jgi:pimeloyl-ACP methyl ester carboxylesterase
MPADPTYVLVHGAWHGAWAWSELERRLEAPTVAVDLPSAAGHAAVLGDLEADTAEVRRAVDAVDGPVVLVAHSYGGLPVTAAAVGAPNVAHIAYVTAFLLEEGDTLLGLFGGNEPDWFIPGDEGATVFPDRPQEVFYNDLPPDVAAAATGRLVPHARSVFTDALHGTAWRDVPTTYVVCEQDNAIPAFAQEAMAARAGTVHRLDSGHSPFLSRPDEIAELLGAVAA